MVVLDTDHMSLIQQGSIEGQRIWSRIRLVPPSDLATSIVSFEEQMRGWMARLTRVSDPLKQFADYAKLSQTLNNYCGITVLDYDDKSIDLFKSLRRQLPLLGTMDLKIAAIALSNNATLLTHNLPDFSKVPTLVAEDWSV